MLRHPGVSVDERPGTRGPRFTGRYQLANGKRPSLPGQPSWQAAFDLARAAQVKVDRARHRDPGGAHMTFIELVEEHDLPLQTELSPVTRRDVASHLGDATGRPRGAGATAARAARHALLAVSGLLPRETTGPQHVRVWQAGLLREHCRRSALLAQRSILRGILELARVSGWLELDPVDQVPPRERPDSGRVLTSRPGP